jgi:hypothetical protein
MRGLKVDTKVVWLFDFFKKDIVLDLSTVIFFKKIAFKNDFNTSKKIVQFQFFSKFHMCWFFTRPIISRLKKEWLYLVVF